MFASSWLRQLQRRWFGRRAIRRQPVRQRVRLQLESLEERLTPATVDVTSTADTLNYAPTVTIAQLNPSVTAVTLRDALNAANNTGGSNTLVLQTGATYDLTQIDNNWYGPDGLPAIASTITINGNGATVQRDTATGTPDFRLFYVSGGLSGLAAGHLALNNLTLEGGVAQGGNSGLGGGGLGAGGAIFNQGTLDLTGVTLTDNQAVGGSSGIGLSLGGGGMGQDAQGFNGGGFGGTFPRGVYGGGGGDGGFGGGNGGNGGNGFGGAIFNLGGSVTATSSTLTGNIARGGGGFVTGDGGGSGSGGAVFNLDGTPALTFCTVADNTVTAGTGAAANGQADGGAVYNLAYGNSITTGSAVTATATITDSILSNTTGGNDLVNNVVNGANTNTATVTLVDKNVVQTSSGTIGGTTALTGDPLLGPLASNGGPTQTMAITPSSSAYRMGTAVAGITTDQRGYTRSTTTAPSLGAYDPNATPPVVAPTLTVSDAGGTYNGHSFSATGTAVGVDGVTPVSGTFGFDYFDNTTSTDLGSTAPTNAGSYTVTATFTSSDPDYNSGGTAQVNFTIGKASATVVVTPYAVTYDGSAHTATVASITGVDGQTGATVGAVTLSTTHTSANPSGYSDSWSFTGAANYNDIASTSITDTINKAALTITASNDSKIYGTSKTFSDTAFTQKGLVSGDTITGVTETSMGAPVAAAVGTYHIVASAATGTGLSNYTISYVNGTLTVFPALTVPGAQTAYENVSQAISGISIGTGLSGSLTLTLAVSNGMLTLGTTGGLTVTGNGSGSVSLTGSTANLNTALATLVYRGGLNFSGADTLSLTISAGSINENASVAITVMSFAQQAANLQAQVSTLQSAGVLSQGQAYSLDVKLNLQNNPGDVGKVQAFLEEAGVFLNVGILTQTQADALLGPGIILLRGLTVAVPASGVPAELPAGTLPGVSSHFVNAVFTHLYHQQLQAPQINLLEMALYDLELSAMTALIQAGVDPVLAYDWSVYLGTTDFNYLAQDLAAFGTNLDTAVMDLTIILLDESMQLI